MPKKIITRKLPERSKLMFYFPNPEEGEQFTIVRMPFYENIDVQESKKARYQDHSIIGRSSNLYTYLGANSRQMTLRFNITLPNIMEEYPEVTEEGVIFKDTNAKGSFKDKQLFLNPTEGKGPRNKIAENLASQFYNGDEYIQSFAQALSEQPPQQPPTLGPNPLVNAALIGAAASVPAAAAVDAAGPPPGSVPQNIKSKVRRNIINVIMYWVNIIRASVVNNSENPVYGPPIIRLRHGILYQDVPCICKNYNLQFNEKAGYDLETLLPRQISVTMMLEEVRAGDFGEFSSRTGTLDIVKRDNLAGWEAVLDDYGSMDPGYSIFDLG